MDRRQAVQLAIVALLIVLIFALIFARRGCVSEVSDKIATLSCEDGIDNDNDGFVDRGGGPDGEPPDEKCLALNEPQERDNLALRSSASADTAGGLLILGDLRLIIPQGALAQQTEIVLERIPGLSPDRLSFSDVYNLTPDNVQLQHPYVLRLKIRPQDPALPETPWLFTESTIHENILIHSVTHLDLETVHFVIGALTHFSKKGGADHEAFKNQWHSVEVGGDCYSPRGGPCPHEEALCHGGIGHNARCASCVALESGRFCCICPPEFPRSDFPCRDSSGNPIVPTGECTPYEYPVAANSCSESLNQSPKGPDGETTLGWTFQSTKPEWNWNVRNGRRRGNQVCGTPTIRNVNINFRLTTHYPRWNNAASCQAEWDRFIGKLREHEKGHADIAKREADRFKRALEAQTWTEICASTPEKLNSNAKKKIEQDSATLATEYETRLKTEWDAYDARTNHGATQGANLNCANCSE